MDKLFDLFSVDMYGHNWLGWVSVIGYFISVLAFAVVVVALITWIFSQIWDAISWKVMVWRTTRSERKFNERHGKHQ